MRSISSNIVPSVSARQIREIDDLAVGPFDNTLAQMMENAGRSLAELVIDQYRVSSVTMLVGPGHNGGGEGEPGASATRSQGVFGPRSLHGVGALRRPDKSCSCG